MSVHRLKCWPESFAAVLDGTKSFEWRRDDRGFDVGDELLLAEFDPGAPIPAYTQFDPRAQAPPASGLVGRYTGRSVTVCVTHILRAPKHGVPEGFVVMSIRRLSRLANLFRGSRP